MNTLSYDTELEERFFDLAIFERSEGLFKMWKLLQLEPKTELRNKLLVILEDIFLIRQEKGVII